MPKLYAQDEVVYKYEELDHWAQNKALETWQNDVYEDHDLWQWDAEYLIEDAKEVGAMLGISITRIYYSGFWSQGDGACFEGSYSYQKGWRKGIYEYLGTPESLAKSQEEGHDVKQNLEIIRIGNELQQLQRRYFYTVSSSVKHSGHYYHEGCTRIENSYTREDSYYDCDLKEDDDEALTMLLRDFMRWIYRQFERQYDWLTSEERFQEEIRDREIYFNEDGTEMHVDPVEGELEDYVEEDETE